MEKMQFSTTTRCETERIRKIMRDGGVERLGAGRWTTDAGTRKAEFPILEALCSVRSVRKRTRASMALARASPRSRDGPAEHLRWNTGSLPTSSRLDASLTYISRENLADKGTKRNAVLLSGVGNG